MLQLEQVGTKHQAIVDEAETVRAELAHQRDNLRNELVELRESHRTLEEKKQIIELSLAQEQDGRRKAELVGEEHKVARQRLTDELTQIRQDLRDEGDRLRELLRTLEHYTDRTVALEKENNALREHFESLQNSLISAQKVSEEAKRALEEERTNVAAASKDREEVEKTKAAETAKAIREAQEALKVERAKVAAAEKAAGEAGEAKRALEEEKTNAAAASKAQEEKEKTEAAERAEAVRRLRKQI